MIIACTHPGKIGDALYSIPAVKKLCEVYNCQSDFIFSEYCEPLKRLFEYQPYIRNVIIDRNYKAERWDMGVQPWNMGLYPDYDYVYHLGFRQVPYTSIPRFIGEQIGIKVDPMKLEYPDFETLNEPYLVLAPRQDNWFRETYKKMVAICPIPVVIVGFKWDYEGYGIDKTGLDFLETATWIAKSKGFIGASANYVVAEGLPVKKVLPHDAHSYDTRHWVYGPLNKFLINPNEEDLLQEFDL